MSLTEKQVRKIAKLSRIRLTDDEVVHFGDELSKIMDWIEVLQEVDTDNIPEMTSVANINLPQRIDEITDGNIQDQILKNAPENNHGCFVVPKVVE